MVAICPYEHIHRLAELGERFFKLAGEKGQINPSYYLAYWKAHYEAGTGCVLVEESDGELKGFLGLVFYREPWTGEVMASENCWYSEGKEGLKLLDLACRLAKDAGAQILYTQHLNTKDSARAAKLFERKGFKLGYMRYLKEL